MSKKVLIVDDYELMHRLLRDLLGKWGSVQVVGEARTGAEALTQVERLKPLVTVRGEAMAGGEARTLPAKLAFPAEDLADRLIITPDLKVNELLDAYPDLEDVLIEIALG